MRAAAAVALLLVFEACVVDRSVPDDARLTCTADGDCPGGWTCVDDLCRPKGWTPDTTMPDALIAETADAAADVVPPRWDDRVTICTALYDKIKLCPTEVKATLGQDVWNLVGDDRDAFVGATCARDLLAEASDSDLDTYLAEAALASSVTCAFFVTVLCDLFPADAGYETSCP